MRLIIRDDENAACAYVANYVAERINAFQPTPEHPFVLGLPTGSSPVGVYDMLVRKYKAGEVSFENVVTFNMDEYVGLPRDDPHSYHTFMWEHFFSHVNIHPSNVHILDGNAPNPEAECDAYEDAIKAAGGIDLFLAGIGEDGHIAFNEPGSSLASRTRVKTLAYDTILSNSRFFDNDLSRVPRMALTVGVQTVLEAREVVVIILGARKALALQKCIEQGVNHMWSLSCLQLHPHPMIVVDEDATLELQVKTVKYFKSIEKVAREQGFEQILPSKVRTGNVAIPATKIEKVQTPTVIAPEPIASHLLRATPTADSARRSPSPDLVPDRMASRIPEPSLNGRLTPKPGMQSKTNGIAV
ncbi:Glucosamine-6-phosphate isomerase (Glucosamine-6-phosphate deaminase) (GNPDA) (GlcN6P deaminase) [Fusarium falciforme]|uniref:Glucosamine-6-phosphate isomerase n=1 Tax=Fusarium falciforme TaxID=195108 RepID=A0A9W8V356_9HYPO|nr:Glucosamine-6-phosphate isomerase (Glucosamine-6-phosphate deaminase) (GNPDA) (GlcN6P deaminase) [Fusarium falciforme]KAJ4194013.1 Glucosamine-6-phosphate isomerase (Glucosamine-6-phosphate deaminase) (GNPDA) (GlcN6P deaminase) [Fusarium falciforme]KAJ4205548.1 Glucosamine-6-phosphate isomerase (Glucosamine-6-phosphate deaminase) (GNPDA) (GlcN6P deaminase) [Fusarium falciforme]KAJ4247359.1 Glucosamine-6-phosphate isomerase (Glucosamine-6-phosphate deaminase) (GNPDA) (GlcN6P deaminase) [Fusari